VNRSHSHKPYYLNNIKLKISNMAAPPQTLEMAMILCGLDNNTTFNGATACQRIAADVFDNDFNSCMDKTLSELDEDFKTYAGLTVNQGQIRVRVQQKKNIRAFMQWCKDKLRVGEDPS
jgi:hypothetical protein